VAPDGIDGASWVTPARILVQRSSVPWTRFDLTVGSDVPCGADIGELRVRVRDLSEDTPTGETVVSLPPVRCIDPPIPAPPSVHDTETDCGGTVQETRRVPRRTADGTTMTCRLPRSPRPATPPPPVVADEGDDEEEDGDSGAPEDGSESTEPEPPDATEGTEPTENDEPSSERDDPAPRPDDTGAGEGSGGEGSNGSSATTESFEERAGSD
jgi:hypothetical protein